MTEADIYSALSECAALNDLALFNGRRAIFCGAPPDDVDLCGYPRCVFDLAMQAGMRRAGVLTVLITASDECGVSSGGMAARLCGELNGWVFGGDCATVLIWKSSREVLPDPIEMRAPRLSSMELEFFLYKFTRPVGVLRAIEEALGALIGADFGDVYSGGACGAVYSLQLSSMRAQDEWPGCAWRVLDAGLYLPGADRAAVFKAYDKLGGLDRLDTAAGGMLVDLVKLDADADGCERAQIALRLRYNAHIEGADADCEPLRRVLIRSDETGRFVCQ